MLKNTWGEYAVRTAPKQRVIVDLINDNTPIFANIPVETASDAVQNVYPELTTVTGGDMGGLDAPLTETSAIVDLGRTDLSRISGYVKVPLNKAQILGGREQALSAQLPHIMKATMVKAESTIYRTMYNYAKANGNYTKAGGSNNANYSMIAVRYGMGMNTGLVSPVIGNGKMFEFFDFDSTGKPVMIKDVNNADIPGHMQMFQTLFGLQLIDPEGVSGIFNIDPTATKVPTEYQISEMLLNAKYDGNTVIYCHPVVLLQLQQYKLSSLQLTNPETGINTVVDAWNGVPIITSYNVPQATETNAA